MLLTWALGNLLETSSTTSKGASSLHTELSVKAWSDTHLLFYLNSGTMECCEAVLSVSSWLEAGRAERGVASEAGTTRAVDWRDCLSWVKSHPKRAESPANRTSPPSEAGGRGMPSSLRFIFTRTFPSDSLSSLTFLIITYFITSLKICVIATLASASLRSRDRATLRVCSCWRRIALRMWFGIWCMMRRMREGKRCTGIKVRGYCFVNCGTGGENWVATSSRR